jgi:hypothetical protein
MRCTNFIAQLQAVDFRALGNGFEPRTRRELWGNGSISQKIGQTQRERMQAAADHQAVASEADKVVQPEAKSTVPFRSVRTAVSCVTAKLFPNIRTPAFLG